MKKYTISAELAMAQIIIENTLSHAEIQKKMAAYTYDRKKMMTGKDLYDEFRTLQMVKQDHYGQQYGDGDAIQALTKEIKASYKKHLKLARIAFEKQRNAEEQLQLNGRRKSDNVGALEQIYTFYSKIGLYMDEITRYNITQEALLQTKDKVDALYKIRMQQLQSKGNAQNTTEKRNEVRKKLKSWIAQFKKTARLALHEDPQLLEVLGIIVPTKKK